MAPDPLNPDEATAQPAHELGESEEWFQQFMSNCPAAAYIKRADGRYLWVNRFVEHLYKRPLRDWTGRTDAELLPPREAADVRARDLAVLERQTTICFTERVTVGDVQQDWLSQKFAIKDRHGQVLLAGVSVNITDQVRAAEEVRRLNSELAARANDLQTVLDLVPVGIYMAHDPECLRITGNRAAAELIASPAGSNLSLTAIPEERPTPHKVLYQGRELAHSELPIQRAAKGDKIYGEEYEIFFEDGTKKHILGWASPLLGAENEIRGSVAAILDITARKRAEQKVADLLAQVTAASRAKDDFLATLAHELRNPLAPIRNAVQILKTDNLPSAKLAWCRDVIDRQVSHMARLLEDLLDVSRISQDKLVLRREHLEMASILDAAVETSRPLVDRSRHRLSVQIPPGSHCVDGDPVRLAQVFANLLNNAAKYTPDQGQIDLVVRHEDKWITVSVRDNGIGIHEGMLPQIFDLFSQAEPALGRAQGGLGIGLALVKGIVELHGGTVTAHSEGPHQGTEIAVRLPAVEADSASADTSGSATSTLLKLRILVVDDNVDIADSLAALLEMTGAEVLCVYDGEQALAAAERFRPAVVLLDIGMPTMSGHEVCRRLRREPWGKEIFIVAMTGWGQEEDRQKTREAGFDHHLVKPADATALLKLLAERAERRGAAS